MWIRTILLLMHTHTYTHTTQSMFMSHLCVFCSSQYLFLSSSSMSRSLASIAPLTGITRAPGSWASTHSLIFANLRKNNQQGELFWILTKKMEKCKTQKTNLPFVLFSDVIFLWEINKVDHGLGRQKQVFVQYLNLWRKFKRARIMFSFSVQWMSPVDISLARQPTPCDQNPKTYWWCNGQLILSIKKWQTQWKVIYTRLLLAFQICILEMTKNG